MDVTFLNENREQIYIADDYGSLIWTERYWNVGDFQLYTAVNPNMLELSSLLRKNLVERKDMFAYIEDSEVWMILEGNNIETNITTGDMITFKGRDLSSMLDRRIVWEQTDLNCGLEDAVKRLLMENVINPAIEERKLEDFLWIPSGDERINQIKIDTQYTGKVLLDAIIDLCKPNAVGFRTFVNEENQFCFQLYLGEDRSYDQTKNQEVLFSPEFENLLNTNYLESVSSFKNVALVAGEDKAQNRKTKVVGSGSGYVRRELFVDARDLQSIRQDGTEVSEKEYQDMMVQRGVEKLEECKYVKAFEGGIEPNTNFVYGVDFFKGDVVQLSNEYEIDGKVRITEVMRSLDETGYTVYPTFEVIEE